MLYAMIMFAQIFKAKLLKSRNLEKNFSEISSGSIVVLVSKVLQQTEMLKYRTLTLQYFIKIYLYLSSLTLHCNLSYNSIIIDRMH